MSKAKASYPKKFNQEGYVNYLISNHNIEKKIAEDIVSLIVYGIEFEDSLDLTYDRMITMLNFADPGYSIDYSIKFPGQFLYDIESCSVAEGEFISSILKQSKESDLHTIATFTKQAIKEICTATIERLTNKNNEKHIKWVDQIKDSVDSLSTIIGKKN
jgi:hypothetical protein